MAPKRQLSAQLHVVQPVTKTGNFASGSIPVTDQTAIHHLCSPSIYLSGRRTDSICNVANSKLCFELLISFHVTQNRLPARGEKQAPKSLLFDKDSYNDCIMVPDF
ncbi:MAG: hypothetical protein A2W90_18265 [Bacteroidetes bacterium GWF2_42_66]|nr:MAG: hypothetical protein A2W92_11650 [Bacteroidetes bacterium GWA2_42_15]OFX98198.1 MAG: hypothetical protein A2W89_09755 [Bacteroidetes bacterium GWE2_42_39]OFY42583.1 MAG: hypothetical protein A2W90_18265 [Bacteroidetes bacterium GWF2_42_66]HBL74299.1 hypothetical protein [Prolixibacteraceae bacterium]HCU64069.1 hypothetical protein [Prolixibacteraceae bacterium]